MRKSTYRSWPDLAEGKNGPISGKNRASLCAVSNGENCIRMRQIHSSEKEVASDLLLEREAR